MKNALLAGAACAVSLIAAPALAQSCETLGRVDNFGAMTLGTRLTELPEGVSISGQCDLGLTRDACVVRDAEGVTYTLYNGSVISKFVLVGDGELPWGFAEGVDRTRAARLLTAQTRVRSTGVLSPDSQVHVRSQFGCGAVYGQVFARYSGNSLISVGLETPL